MYLSLTEMEKIEKTFCGRVSKMISVYDKQQV